MPYKDPEKAKASARVCAEKKWARRRLDPDFDALCRQRATAYGKRWRVNNPEKVKAARAMWLANGGKEWLRSWREPHNERYKAERRERYRQNREFELARNKEWEKNNPEKHIQIRRTKDAVRRARKWRRGPNHTWREWVALVRATGNKCLRCWCAGNEKTLHRDHIVPLAQGGFNDISNIQPLCQPCNAWKHHTRVIDYRFDRWAPMEEELQCKSSMSLSPDSF